MCKWVNLVLFHTNLSLRKKTFENIVEKEEHAGNQHFLLFPQFFLPFLWQIFTGVKFHLSSENAFILIKFKVLSHGKELTFYHTIPIFNDPLKEKNF